MVNVVRPQDLALVNLATGEIVERNVVVLGKKGEVDTGYVKVFVAFLSDIINDKEITGKAVRLLLYMVERLDWNSLRIIIEPRDAMKELEIGRKTFYEWINTLIKKEIISKINTHVYELKPYSFVKGSMVEVKSIC